MCLPDTNGSLYAEGKTTKFLSEAELQKNKERHGGSLEDGTFSGRTLTEAILAQREEKEQKFQEGWKTMKQGTCSKPLVVHICSNNPGQG